jgi:hypothetical protein
MIEGVVSPFCIFGDRNNRNFHRLINGIGLFILFLYFPEEMETGIEQSTSRGQVRRLKGL